MTSSPTNLHAMAYVQALQGDPDKWDQWPEIRRCNPLTAISADFRRKLLPRMRDALVCPAGLPAQSAISLIPPERHATRADESTMLLTRRGLGTGTHAPRSSARRPTDLCLRSRRWPYRGQLRSGSGDLRRMEAVAVAPGIASLEDQEKRDRVPRGTYRALVQNGALRFIAEGLRVQPPAQLHDAVSGRVGAAGCCAV